MSITAKEFRQIALSFPETEAKQHMGHPDFRVAGKIFATLGYPDKSFGMVKLTAIEQRMFMGADPKAFQPCAGAWGRKGATSVKLSSVRKPTLHRAMVAAWELAAPARLRDAKKEHKPRSGKKATTRV